MQKLFNFEKKVIDPLLKTIEKHQEYLTRPENLPQLAKLGYMFETLFIYGRMCWGHEGIIRKSKKGICENNPRYEINDNIAYKSDDIENLVYDAWGLHVSGSEDRPSLEEFYSIIEGRFKVSEFEQRMRRPSKTFDEWVELLTDNRYKYHSIHRTRRGVANSLLCVNGSGHSFFDGYIADEGAAGGDTAIYGLWEESKFHPDIQAKVDAFMSYPEVRQTVEVGYADIQKWLKEKEERDYGPARERIKDSKKLLEHIRNEIATNPKTSYTQDSVDVLEKIISGYDENGKIIRREIEQHDNYSYYPISNYSNITKMDENTHVSYIKAGLEICEDIVSHYNSRFFYGLAWSLGVGKEFEEGSGKQLKWTAHDEANLEYTRELMPKLKRLLEAKS
jgi:hypothetical protein